MTENIVWHDTQLLKQDRRKLKKHHSAVIWFTGLSGSGKSTLANALEQELYKKDIHSYILDGDNVRHGLNSDLGFSDEDRKENIRRIGEVSKLFIDSGSFVLTAFISPFIEDRAQVRNLIEEDEFVEVYVECELDSCEKRDPKGLYKKARNGEIPQFTGISSPYEKPINPEITVNTEKLSVEDSVKKIIQYLEARNWI
ncbi:adenylyl-sulfate kinase [Bacillus solimangrovi]|uniref:Adenylyl-sulfate kinase n=1 Tax=Bacillus solimangrovi TaxID=1305675 RepID=A0A1E5LF83_9BACI|nr:adenylyl-sulfate kinase [Bacillus solimangrovi]OEH92745.1 adenylyl-sulfate kinase [Bacillus solimangrovi]